jgi:micrococcal nuclease
MLRRLVPVVLAMLAVAPTAAQARVRVLQAASGSPGQSAALTVSVSPSATCSITVMYKSGSSHAKGLTPKRGGVITWSWMIGTNTTPGTWPIYVSCGSAGTISTSIRVR